MCHYGFTPVPDFRDRYYRRPDESPAENCAGCGISARARFIATWTRASDWLRWCFTSSGSIAVIRNRCATSPNSARMSSCAWKAQSHAGVEHHTQVESALKARDYLSALWHCRMAREHQQASQLIQRFIADLAGQPELDQHLAALHQSSPTPADEIDLYLVEGRGSSGVYAGICNLSWRDMSRH